MSHKADHVIAETRKGHDGTHLCHGGCGKAVVPAKWGCTRCWFRLPKHLRNRIWLAYRPGQETDKRPSAEYLAVATEVQQWIHKNPLPAKPSSGNLF